MTKLLKHRNKESNQERRDSSKIIFLDRYDQVNITQKSNLWTKYNIHISKVRRQCFEKKLLV